MEADSNEYECHDKLILYSNQIINTLFYLMYLIKKTTHHQQSFQEGNVKLSAYMKLSQAFQETRGMNLNFELLSVQETRQVIRKTFEMYLLLFLNFFSMANNLKSSYVMNLHNELEKHKQWIQSLLRDYD